MAVNRATLDLIIEYEGLRTEAYPDPAHGWNVPTIGVGHTSAAGLPKVYMGMQITEAEAYAILERDLMTFEGYVRAGVTAQITDNMFGALVSFCFNVGPKNFAKSTLLKKLNAGDFESAAKEFVKWDKAGGKTLRGLTRRRVAEADLFRSNAIPASTPAKPQQSLWQAFLARLWALIKR